jgi:hypothetical protein
VRCPALSLTSANPSNSSLRNRSHTLQIAHNQHIRIHESADTILQARSLAAVEFAGGDTSGYAFAEADIGEMMDGWWNGAALVI